VSNGLEVSQTTSGNFKTTHFHHGYPIPAYLIAIAVTNYQIYNQQAGLGTTASPYFPIVNYLYPESATANITNLAPTPAIMNFFESKFGNYPFRTEKYGHAQFGWGGGMEHTTVSFMGSFGRSLIAHEMAHQWFGDKITCGTWQDIWLNEGITEYLSGLVVEHLDGNVPFVDWKDGKITNITSLPNGAVYLTESEALIVNRIFSRRLTYNKGSMVNNMLRYKMGDTAYFAALNNYLNDPNLAYGYAVTTQFKDHLETAYGSSLTEFFDDWVYDQGYPTYTILAENISSTQTKIKISQTQSHSSVSFFEMPVPIRLTGAGGEVFNTNLENTTNGQEFIVTTPFTVTGILFDPEKNIISKNNTATLAASNFQLEGSIFVFPNPAHNEIEVQIPATVHLELVTIYNTLGQKIVETNDPKINTTSLSEGTYFVSIATSIGVFHKKMIKK
jgi:aminopeptidase N